MQVVTSIHRRLAELSPSEAQVGRYVLDHLEAIPLVSLQGLAQRSQTSDATVLRFCVSLDFSGFQEFKTTLTGELIERGLPRARGASGADRYAALLAADLERTLANVAAADLDRVAAAVAASRHTVVVGLAGSGAVAEILVAGLLGLNVAAVRASDRVAIERWGALVGGDDVLIGVSHSGAAPEVEAAVRRARGRGALTAALTNADRSELAAAADVPLVTSATERLLGSNACHPRIVELAVLELLLDAVAAYKRGTASMAV